MKRGNFITKGIPDYDALKGEDTSHLESVSLEGFPDHLINDKDIKRLGFDWRMQDTLETDDENGVYIVNTDTSKGSGIHWLCVYKDSPEALYVYDSFGRDISKLTPILFEKFHESGHDVIGSPFRNQHKTTNVCGYMSLALAKLINRYIAGGKKLTPRAFVELIYKQFGVAPDLNDIARALKVFKQ